MSEAFLEFLRTETKSLEQAGLLRKEIALSSPQGPSIMLGDKEMVNLASSDYLGLANNAELKRAAKAAVDNFGAGVGSPRAVLGTMSLHVELEQAVAKFVGTEDAVIFPSGYQANAGLLESLLGNRDFVFCDEQIRANLADGVRLCRARVYPYRNYDLSHLEDRLKRSRAARFRAIVTDGVFPLDGVLAKLREVYFLAEKYDAIVIVDDGQGIGILGASGRGTHEARDLMDQIEIVTGTFGNALGGGAGGFVAARKEVTTWLRQKSRPYLTSTALAPAAAAAALRALEFARGDAKGRETLVENMKFIRDGLSAEGLQVIQGEHPAVAVMIGHAVTAQRMTDLLFRKGIFAMGFCHPVVPEGAARIRAQVTAKHTQKALKAAIVAFAEAAKELKLPRNTAVQVNPVITQA